jgi:superfamily II helicase
MIIAANTSAGKTIAAELLIDATLKKGQRVIYLSPLKTLTEEKYTEWQIRYQKETIAIMTGDYILTTDKLNELLASRIIVMTSEMMDSRTRKFESEKNHWMKEVGLVVVDESHILTTSRGDAVETGIMRFTLHCPEARILFLSATMPNVKELGDWLTSLERSFKDRDNGIRVLVSTSTNAWGVNLPARNVVIVGVHRGFEKVDELNIIQMAGRAGRYNIDTEGHVYLIVPAGEADYWTGIFSNPRPVRSVLNDHQKLAFHVLAEIYRKAITTEADLFSWYERSLAFRQGRVPFSRIEAEAVFHDLKQRKMIRDKNGRLQITGLGLTSAVMYYSPYDIDAWYKNFCSAFANNLETNEEVVAWAIGTIPRYSSYVPREYKTLIDRWKSTFQGCGFYFDEKAVLSLEAVYNCLNNQKATGALRSKMVEIKNDAQRIIIALRMIDERYAHWNQTSFWKDLESKFADLNKNHPKMDNFPGGPAASNSIGSQQSEHAVSKPSEDYDEADIWGDADWAEFLGCDEDEVDYYFDSQM